MGQKNLRSLGTRGQKHSRNQKQMGRKITTVCRRRDLKGCREVPASYNWSYKTYSDLYIKAHQLRYGALPTRIRTSRGQRRNERDSNCRAGCLSTETATHIIQQCHRTHGGRIRRHDQVVKILADKLEHEGWLVKTEETYRMGDGNWRPDIVAKKGPRTVVVDAQIRNGNMETCQAEKRKKYARNRALLRAIADKHQAIRDAEVTTATLSWKGIWSKKSASDLLALGCRREILTQITSRTMEGSWACWTRFNQMTTMLER